ncbi:hypothetical protein PAXRUDRAFT_153917, partial [Paxillus rubicundulus Ve08.2h10]
LATASSDMHKPDVSFQSLPMDVLFEILDVFESPLSYALDDFHAIELESQEGDPIHDSDNVQLSRHSPHLRLRTLCTSLRNTIDEYRPFWQYLRIDWTEPSALEISKLWFRNRRIGGIHLSVVPYKYYTKKHAQLIPPPPVPTLLDCLGKHGDQITSATFHLPNGVDYLLPLAQGLQPHVERMQYVKLHCNMPDPCATRHSICGGGQWVMLDRLHADRCDHQWDPSVVKCVRRKIWPLLTRVLYQLQLPINVKTKMGPGDSFLCGLVLPIRWEILSELVLLHGCDSVTMVHDLLTKEGASSNLQTLYIEMKMTGLPHPERKINREHEICIPRLTTLTFIINLEGYHKVDIPKDGQQRVLDFIATFRCSGLTYLAIFSDAIGDCEGPMNERIDLPRLLCLSETTLLPIKCLKIDANFYSQDLLSILDRAVNLEYLSITSWEQDVFNHLLHTLTWDFSNCRYPGLQELCFIGDGIECGVDQMMEVASLSHEVVMSRLGHMCSETIYPGLPKAQSEAEWFRYTQFRCNSFTRDDGQELRIFYAGRNW